MDRGDDNNGSLANDLHRIAINSTRAQLSQLSTINYFSNRYSEKKSPRHPGNESSWRGTPQQLPNRARACPTAVHGTRTAPN
eukprot:6434319-Pyramimonas_sp.AAC.1